MAAQSLLLYLSPEQQTLMQQVCGRRLTTWEMPLQHGGLNVLYGTPAITAAQRIGLGGRPVQIPLTLAQQNAVRKELGTACAYVLVNPAACPLYGVGSRPSLAGTQGAPTTVYRPR